MLVMKTSALRIRLPLILVTALALLDAGSVNAQSWGNEYVDAFHECFDSEANIQVQFIIGQVPKNRLDTAVEFANNMCAPIARETMMAIGVDEFMEIVEVIERDFYRSHGQEHH